jgi:methyl-accepting chemotaxis protein
MKARLFTNFLMAFIIYSFILTVIGYTLAMIIWNGYLPSNFMMFAMPTISIIVSIILGVIFGKRIAKRFEKLAGIANEIKYGNYNVRISPLKDDEIGELETAFQQMVLSVKLLCGTSSKSYRTELSKNEFTGRIAYKFIFSFIVMGIILSIYSRLLSTLQLISPIYSGPLNLLFSTGLGIIFSWILIKSIGTPIKTITNAANEVKNGNMDVSVKLVNTDEIGILANTFNEMVYCLRDRIESISIVLPSQDS